jgi:protein TonB
MVPPEEIEELNAPTTLPADFGEWDSADVPATQPAKPATARVTVPPVAERIPHAASRPPAAAYTEAEQVFHPPQTKGARAEGEKRKDEDKGNKKGLVPLVAVGSITLLLVVGGVSLIKMKSGTAMPKPVAAPQTVTTTPQPVITNLPVATPAKTPDTTETDRQRAQSDQMNRQLNAPSRIPNDLKMLAGKEPPPSSGFSASGLDGLGGSGVAGNVFSGQNGPRVKIAAPSKISISAGVAGGLLIQKTSPVYPQIAREARVSGTVVIQATISRSGELQNLRAVSGPTMLRQAALDAVRTWRYKPYLLDGQPVDVETTVSVNFSLGG